MAAQQKLEASASVVVARGEEIQAVLPGRTRNPSWHQLNRVPFVRIVSAPVLLVVNLVSNPRVVLVATSRRLLVCHRSRWRSEVTDVIRELPRETKIGFVNGPPWFKTETLGQKVWFQRRHAEGIMRADLKGRTPASEHPGLSYE